MAAKKTKKSSPVPPPRASSASKPDHKALTKEIGNALFTDEERAGMFLAKHWKKLTAAAVIAVVAITGAFAAVKHHEAKKRADVAALAQADTAEKIEAALAADPRTPGADAARFKLAKMHEEKKEYDKARKVLNDIVGTTEDGLSRNMARLKIAYLLELDPKVKNEDAAKEFSVIAGTPGFPVSMRAEAGYSAGRLYIDLKRNDDAQKVLGLVRQMSITPAKQPVAAEWKMRAMMLESSIN